MNLLKGEKKMAEHYFSEQLSERQLSVVLHYMDILGATPDNMHFLKTEEYIGDLFPVDLIVFEPTQKFKYYTVATVGLSEYRFNNNFARSELMMTLPLTWKPIFDKEEYYWAPQLLRDIAYCVVGRKQGVNIGQVYLLENPNEEAKYTEFSDAIGGIITLPEMYPLTMFEREIGESFTRFFQVVPVSKPDVQKMDEVGPLQFIQFDLHDSENPLMVVKLKEKQVEGIDRLIQQNETSLKGTNDNN